MMARIIVVSIFTTFLACSNEPRSHAEFVDAAIDLTIKHCTGDELQFPTLYDKLVDKIPDDEAEDIFLVGKLKARGFEIPDWGRGNLPPLGPRVVDVGLRKGDCVCRVSKMYISTTVDSLFQVVEGIRCRRTRGQKDR